MSSLYKKTLNEITSTEILLLAAEMAEAYSTLVSPDISVPEFQGYLDIRHIARVEFGGVPLIEWFFDEVITGVREPHRQAGLLILDRAISMQRESLAALEKLRRAEYGPPEETSVASGHLNTAYDAEDPVAIVMRKNEQQRESEQRAKDEDRKRALERADQQAAVDRAYRPLWEAVRKVFRAPGGRQIRTSILQVHEFDGDDLPALPAHVIPPCARSIRGLCLPVVGDKPWELRVRAANGRVVIETIQPSTGSSEVSPTDAMDFLLTRLAAWAPRAYGMCEEGEWLVNGEQDTQK